MAKIQSFPKTKLKNKEWLEANSAIVAKFESMNAAVSIVKPQYDAYHQIYEVYRDSIILYTKSEYTVKSSVAKRELTNVRKSIMKLIDGNKRRRDTAHKNAALSLLAALSEYVKDKSLGFEELIADTDTMIMKMESDECKENITLLLLDDPLTELKTTNNECKQIKEKKRVEVGRRSRPRKPEVVRPELNKAYEELVAELNASARREGDKDLLSLFTWWNALIDSYRKKLSDRYGTKAGGKQDSGKSNLPFDKEEGGDDDDRPVIE